MSNKTPITKEQELAILADAVKALGTDSYCGGWLAGVMAEVESNMKSDFIPAMTISATMERCREIEAQTIEAANYTLATANGKAEEITSAARKEADGIRNRIAEQLRGALRTFDR